MDNRQSGSNGSFVNKVSVNAEIYRFACWAVALLPFPSHFNNFSQNEDSSEGEQGSQSNIPAACVRQPRRHSIATTYQYDQQQPCRLEMLRNETQSHSQHRFNFHRLAESATDGKKYGNSKKVDEMPKNGSRKQKREFICQYCQRHFSKSYNLNIHEELLQKRKQLKQIISSNGPTLLFLDSLSPESIYYK